MPIYNRIADFQDDLIATRQDIHACAENAGSHHAENQDVYNCVVPGASACMHRWMDLGWSRAS